ncbi:uncharacterized protein LOC141526628 [Cotesia typhae]|uniref:uncharacterized protein LOC141526628 n=1 Tax=Cotesia typhae TaxID=2053667 RepID=UPI003D6889A0
MDENVMGYGAIIYGITVLATSGLTGVAVATGEHDVSPATRHTTPNPSVISNTFSNTNTNSNTNNNISNSTTNSISSNITPAPTSNPITSTVSVSTSTSTSNSIASNNNNNLNNNGIPSSSSTRTRTRTSMSMRNLHRRVSHPCHGHERRHSGKHEKCSSQKLETSWPFSLLSRSILL